MMDELKQVWGEFLGDLFEKVWQNDKQNFYNMICKSLKWLAAQSDNKLDDAAVELICKALDYEGE